MPGAADAVLTYFTTQTALEDAYFGDNGIVQGARKGTQIIDLSCTTPTFARELNAMACVADLVAVEAPLVVTDVAVPDTFAARENLGCFVGGEEDCVEAAREVLDPAGRPRHRCRRPGSAPACPRRVQPAGCGAAGRPPWRRMRCTTRCARLPTWARSPGMRAGAITPAGDALLAAVTDGRFDGTYTVEMLMGELTAALTTADDADLILPQAEAVQRLLELLAIIGGSDKAPSALSLVYREEDACAKEGLDWTRAEQTYGDHDHDHDEDADWGDDFGDAGIMDDDGMMGAYPGFN